MYARTHMMRHNYIHSGENMKIKRLVATVGSVALMASALAIPAHAESYTNSSPQTVHNNSKLPLVNTYRQTNYLKANILNPYRCAMLERITALWCIKWKINSSRKALSLPRTALIKIFNSFRLFPKRNLFQFRITAISMQALVPQHPQTMK